MTKIRDIRDSDLNLIRYALSSLSANLSAEDLEELGLAETDDAEHGTEDTGFTDSDVTAVMESRLNAVEADLQRLCELFS